MAPYKRPPLINLVKTGFDADGKASSPLYVQLYRHVRSLILDDVLDAGARLPSSRTLARDIGLSRTTVELAYDELAAEGFVERRRGSGTYVVDLHPALPDRPGVPGHKPENPADVLDMLSREGARTMATTSFRDDPTQPSGFAP
ncbi:MAG: winged helix-turn-helix domain-containing protein, partial [Bacteroidota bacterium]